MKNFNEFKTATAVKNEARAIAAEMVKTFFIEKMGEENVSVIGSNEIAVCLGTKALDDGSIAEVCVTFKPTAKDYEDRKATKKTFEAFERLVEADIYEETQQKKTEEKAKKEKEKKTNKTKTKAEKDRELAEKKAELDAIAEKVTARQKAELAEQVEKAKAKKAEIANTK